MPDNVSITDSL